GCAVTVEVLLRNRFFQFRLMLIIMLYESIWDDDVKNEQGPLGARRLFASNVGAAGSRVPTFRSDPSQSLFLQIAPTHLALGILPRPILGRDLRCVPCPSRA